MNVAEDSTEPAFASRLRDLPAHGLLIYDHPPMLCRFSLPLVVVAVCASGCVRATPPTDTGDPVVTTPTAPTGPTTTPTSPTAPAPSGSSALAYNPEMKQLFASDCVVCHGTSRADGNYRMATYAQVMAAVRPGSASSLLISDTQPNGRMYRYFSGSTATRQAKADQVRTWIVVYNAQENQ